MKVKGEEVMVRGQQEQRKGLAHGECSPGGQHKGT